MRTTELRRQAHVAALLIGFPAFPALAVMESPGVITGLFALVLVVLGRQVWRSTGEDAMTPPHDLYVPVIPSRE